MIQCLNSILKEVMNMDKDKSIKLFEQKTIRTHWDEAQEKWFFSIQDVVEVLTDTPNPKDYIKKGIPNCSIFKYEYFDKKFKLIDIIYPDI